MNTYEAYKNKEFDLTAFGLDRCGGDDTYFCTPVGADIFAAPGVDGIHYCTIGGFGEMVFAISPSNGVGEFVHPVAKSFDDFLALLLMCEGDAAIEQCWQWSQEQFDQFMGEQEVLPETKQAALHLMELTGLEPMELPYKYIHDLQKFFNDKSIPFSEEYYKTVPQEDQEEPKEFLCEQPATPWAVYYEDNFWASEHEDAPSEEISIEKNFRWADRDWYIPSVYTCEKGMVADILMRMDSAEFKAFTDRWGVTLENEHTFSREQREQMERENPMIFHFRADLNINGGLLRSHRGCSMAYIPFMDACDQEEWEMILDYYNLDQSSCWVIQRSSYPWEDGQIIDIAAMEVTMIHQPMFLPGTTFETSASGETHTFQNPVTGISHILTVHEYEKSEIECDFPDSKVREYPRHYIEMTFSLEPELQQSEFSLRDTKESDAPCVIPNQSTELRPSGAESIGIIGGADGPTAMILGMPDSKEHLHAAVSGFRFEPFDCVRWQISFREKKMKEMTIELMEVLQ